MRVLSVPIGRLGNTIFRYLATVVFHIVYNAKIINHTDVLPTEPFLKMTDDAFIQWMKSHLTGGDLGMDMSITYGFFGFFQHDAIYLKYRQQIIDYISKNMYDILLTDGKTPERPDFSYLPEQHPSGVLLVPPFGFNKFYDTVVHLRLEDFIDNNLAIHPESIKILLDTIGAKSYCIVMNCPQSEIELQYLNYLKQYFDITVESNDIITDYHIMKNAKTLVCSCSTLSWAAAFFSETVRQVYMPNYYMGRAHETFRKPIENTTLYYYRQCTKVELEAFLARN
jgi:hypothetical protein